MKILIKSILQKPLYLFKSRWKETSNGIKSKIQIINLVSMLEVSVQQ
jgi:hypothetical protein